MRKNIVLDEIQQFNLELILNGSYKPLNSFMGENNYISVLNENKSVTNKYFPFPIVLQISNETYENINKEKVVYLVDEYVNSWNELYKMCKSKNKVSILCNLL